MQVDVKGFTLYLTYTWKTLHSQKQESVSGNLHHVWTISLILGQSAPMKGLLFLHPHRRWGDFIHNPPDCFWFPFCLLEECSSLSFYLPGLFSLSFLSLPPFLSSSLLRISSEKSLRRGASTWPWLLSKLGHLSSALCFGRGVGCPPPSIFP